MWYSYRYYHNHSGQSTSQTRKSTAGSCSGSLFRAFISRLSCSSSENSSASSKSQRPSPGVFVWRLGCFPANQDIWVCWVLNRKLATEDTDAFDILQASGLQPCLVQIWVASRRSQFLEHPLHLRAAFAPHNKMRLVVFCRTACNLPRAKVALTTKANIKKGKTFKIGQVGNQNYVAS